MNRLQDRVHQYQEEFASTCRTTEIRVRRPGVAIHPSRPCGRGCLHNRSTEDSQSFASRFAAPCGTLLQLDSDWGYQGRLKARFAVSCTRTQTEGGYPEVPSPLGTACRYGLGLPFDTILPPWETIKLNLTDPAPLCICPKNAL